MCLDIGYDVVAVDCYADSDTFAMAKRVVKVSSLALSDITAVIEELRQVYDFAGLLYGSGFECYLETLAYLEDNCCLWGNSFETFQRIQDKCDFFKQLEALSIPYPEVAFTPPAVNEGWLMKPWQGEGGLAIRHYAAATDAHEGYWQRYIQGEPMSVLFACHGARVEMIGFNRQWTIDLGEHPGFAFAGICSNVVVSEVHWQMFQQWLTELSAVYSLTGLNSIDFIFKDGCCYVLEINARIPASAQLYGEALLLIHLQACAGGFDGETQLLRAPRAYQIVYARQPVRIPLAVDWPDWASDRPNPGALVGTGEPICSIIAAGKTPGQVKKNLVRQQRILENLLETGL